MLNLNITSTDLLNCAEMHCMHASIQLYISQCHVRVEDVDNKCSNTEQSGADEAKISIMDQGL